MSQPTAKKDQLSTDALMRMFNDAALRYHRSFPGYLKTLFVSLPSGPVFIAPQIAETLSENVAEVAALLSNRMDWMFRHTAIAAAGVEVIGQQELSHISLRTDKISEPRYISQKLPAKIDLMTVFDHEIGHLVVEHEKLPSRGFCHVRECAADAYAVLRHVQRFGKNTDLFDYAPFNMALNVTLGASENHYTSGVMLAIARMRQADIRALSLQETARLAGELAVNHALDAKVLHKIFLAYAPARKLYGEETRDWPKIVAGVVNVMHANKHDPDIYMAGKLSLSQPNFWALVSPEDRAFINSQPAALQTGTTPTSPR